MQDFHFEKDVVNFHVFTTNLYFCNPYSIFFVMYKNYFDIFEISQNIRI